MFGWIRFLRSANSSLPTSPTPDGATAGSTAVTTVAVPAAPTPPLPGVAKSQKYHTPAVASFRFLTRILAAPFRLVRRRPIASLLAALLVVSAAVVAVHGYALYQYQQAEKALDEDRLPDAVSHMSFCLTVWPYSASTHLLAARIARSAGFYSQAESQLNECRRLGGATEETQLEMMLLRAQRGEADQVDASLLYAAEHDPAHKRQILEALARGNINLMRFLPALVVLDRCLKDYPDDVRALDWQGWVLERLGQRESAANDYERALSLSPGRAEVRLRLARLYLEQNDPIQAEALLQKLGQDQQGQPDVQLALAQCRFLQGKEKEAEALLERVLAVAPDEPTALLYRGKLELQAGRPAEAESYFRRSLKAEPFNSEALNCLYDSLRSQPGREAEADAAQQDYHRLLAKGQRIHQLLNGEVDKASTDPQPAYELGQLNLEIGREDMALYWLNTALNRDPRHKPTHALLADYLEKKGDKEAAAEHRRAAEN